MPTLLMYARLDGPTSGPGHPDVSDQAGGRTFSRSGSAAWGPGPGTHQALTLDGGGWVDLPPLGLSGAVPFTLSARLKSTDGAIQEWLSATNCELLRNYPAADDLTVYSGGNRLTAHFPLTDWRHVAVVSTGTTLSLYGDGALLGSTPYALAIADDHWAIGRSGPQMDKGWRGGIAEVRIYAGAQTADQVAADAKLDPRPMTRLRGLLAVSKILADSGLFARVLLGKTDPSAVATDETTPRAWIYPTSWYATGSADDGASEGKTCICRFEVAVTVRPTEGGDLDALTDAVQDLIHGQALAESIPALTFCEQGRYLESSPKNPAPEQTAVVSGEFAYLAGTTTVLPDPAPPSPSLRALSSWWPGPT